MFSVVNPQIDNLICFQRDGLTPVPGCHGLGKSGADYCINPQSELLHTGQCSPTSRCDICKGACNTNADCVGNLSCFKRIANEPVPNCFGSGVTGVGYCYAAPNTTLSNTPGSDDCAVVPCGLCQGDCDNDKECRPGLMCLQRDANEVQYYPVLFCYKFRALSHLFSCFSGDPWLFDDWCYKWKGLLYCLSKYS